MTSRRKRFIPKRRGKGIAVLESNDDLDTFERLEDRIDRSAASKALAKAKGMATPWKGVKKELGL